jgi:hypothetical protein
MEEDNNSRDTVEEEEADADADTVEETDVMDKEAAVVAITLDKETTTNKRQVYHRPQQPHGQEIFPLPQTTIKEEAVTATTNPICTRGTTIGGTVTRVIIMLIMRV